MSVVSFVCCFQLLNFWLGAFIIQIWSDFDKFPLIFPLYNAASHCETWTKTAISELILSIFLFIYCLFRLVLTLFQMVYNNNNKCIRNNKNKKIFVKFHTEFIETETTWEHETFFIWIPKMEIYKRKLYFKTKNKRTNQILINTADNRTCVWK